MIGWRILLIGLAIGAACILVGCEGSPLWALHNTLRHSVILQQQSIEHNRIELQRRQMELDEQKKRNKTLDY